MDEIKDVIKKVFGDIATTKNHDQKNIHTLLDKILGEKEKKHAKISGFKNEILSIDVDSSAWLYQFNLKRSRILKTVQDKGYPVKKIYFQIGKMS